MSTENSSKRYVVGYDLDKLNRAIIYIKDNVLFNLY